MSGNGKKRVLSLNLHGLGDFIMTMPVLSALAGAGFKSITSLVWPALEDMALTVPHIDHVVPLPKEEENDPALTRFVTELSSQRQGFDLVLDFSFPPRSQIITRALEGSRIVGFDIDRDLYPWYTDTVPQSAEEHILRRNLSLLELLDIEEPDWPDFSIRTPEGTAEHVKELLAGGGIDPLRDRPVAIHPGSGVAKRNWPAERFAELADIIFEFTGRPVVILGGRKRAYDGSDEQELAARMESCMLSKAVNLAGKLSLPELAALLTECSLFVGNNSGPAHLAASVCSVPVLVVWAPRNEKVWRPFGHPVEIISAATEDACPGECLGNGCERMQHCLGSVSVADVFGRFLRAFSDLGACPAGNGRA